MKTNYGEIIHNKRKSLKLTGEKLAVVLVVCVACEGICSCLDHVVKNPHSLQ